MLSVNMLNDCIAFENIDNLLLFMLFVLDVYGGGLRSESGQTKKDLPHSIDIYGTGRHYIFELKANYLR